jgi:hypothetical protein
MGQYPSPDGDVNKVQSPILNYFSKRPRLNVFVELERGNTNTLFKAKFSSIGKYPTRQTRAVNSPERFISKVPVPWDFHQRSELDFFVNPIIQCKSTKIVTNALQQPWFACASNFPGVNLGANSFPSFTEGGAFTGKFDKVPSDFGTVSFDHSQSNSVKETSFSKDVEESVDRTSPCTVASLRIISPIKGK